MKRTYGFILAGAFLFSTGLYSCSSDNTTGVETGAAPNATEDTSGGMMQEQTDQNMMDTTGTGTGTNTTGTDTTGTGTGTGAGGGSGTGSGGGGGTTGTGQ